MKTTQELIRCAWENGTAIAAFNIPYLLMMEPVVRALRDTRTVGLIAVARLEWVKFQSQSLAAIKREYDRVKDTTYTRLHLDHVPVIDEDGLSVDYLPVMKEAIQLGYESLMIDGSRLPLEENIAAARAVADLGHAAGLPVEAELGAVMGHEAGPLPPYDELFASGKGFTDPDEAARLVRESGVDWLSVAIGNIHGAISRAKKTEHKVKARLQLEHLERINRKVNRPLVLHGGSGIRPEYIKEGIRRGIAKINIGTAIRQPYEAAMTTSIAAGQEAVYRMTVQTLVHDLGVAGSAKTISA